MEPGATAHSTRRISKSGRLAPAIAGTLIHAVNVALAAEATTQHTLWDDPGFEVVRTSAAVENARENFSRRGVTVEAKYIGEVFTNPHGGFAGGSHYHGLLDIETDLDLEKLLGWKGLTFHANGYQSHGTSITAESVGSIAAVSHIEATPTTRLFEAWFEQSALDGTLSLRFGQLAVDAEFATLPSAGAFISSTFGWNTLMTDNVPNGGPIYPLATPGARLKFQPTDSVSMMAAIYNGDPVGECSDDPQKCNAHGTEFRLSDPPLVIGEAAYQSGAELPGVLKAGAWWSFEDFDDQRFADDGSALADPSGSGAARRHDGNGGVYAVIHQMLYRVSDSPERGIHAFARAARSIEDRNQIDFYLEVGITLTGLLDARPGDVLGIGFAHSHISESAAGFDRDLSNFNSIKLPVRQAEQLLEISYTARLAKGWSVQPDFQYYWSPGGHVADSSDPSGLRTIPNAAVFGLRTILAY